MKGATALPCASTIRPPKITIIIMIGINQNFFLLTMNVQSSFINDIFYILKIDFLTNRPKDLSASVLSNNFLLLYQGAGLRGLFQMYA